MKVRTLTELQTLLDSERSWRLKEIASLKALVRTSQSTEQSTAIRAGVALLYAHWEGFIKQSATGYLTYVSSQRLKYEQLTAEFVVLGAKNYLGSLMESRKARLNKTAVEFFLTKQSDRANVTFAGAVNTESNLSSAVFDNLAISIGIDASKYETKYNFIDESLLKRRNSIAHGEFLDIDSITFLSLADEVIQLMTNFKNDIENAASIKAFLRS